jgi:energy-coupling factor transport system ATP-binding protein
MSVEIRDLGWRYQGAAEPALAHVNLSISPGEWITITGPSGCGKSTLALALTGFIPHRYEGEFTGSIRMDGVETRSLSPQQLAGRASMAQQDPESQLCTLVVEDEVAFGPENLCLSPEVVHQRLEWALSSVGASHLRHRSLYTLSGGEKQRVAIAAVLSMHPRLLILDEPTANLDPRGVSEVLQVIEGLRRRHGITVMVIEHRLAPLLPLSDRLIVMADGRIVADTPPHQSGALHLESGGSPPCPIPPAGRKRLLGAENLCLKRGDQRVLDRVSFDLHEGEIVALMGENGSGKTSLLFTLLGIHKPDAGTVRWRQRDITAQRVFRRASLMGLTFQNPNHQIFEHTVEAEATLAAGNLAAVPPPPDRVHRLLEELDLNTYLRRHPLALSMGEKKRLCLASVLLYRPPLLLLDEPAIGQDHARWLHQERLLHRFGTEGGTVLMVCHEPAMALGCHRILFLHRGQLLVDAPPPEAFRQLARQGFEAYLPRKGVGDAPS